MTKIRQKPLRTSETTTPPKSVVTPFAPPSSIRMGMKLR